MLRCILIASGLTASALHSPSLQEVDASEEVAGDDTALKVAAEDKEEIENEQDKDVDVDESADSVAEVAGDVDVDDDLDGDDDDDDLDLDDVDDDLLDDDDDDFDLDDVDDDGDLDSLVEESGDVGEDNGDDDDEDDDDSDDDDDDDDDEDDEDEDEEDEDVAEKSPTMLAEAEEGGESREFEFVADMPLEKGPTDQASVFAKAKAAGKPAMVLATKSWCPHCKDLAESMNADAGMKTLMSKFVAFHAPDASGEAWHGDIGYVPRAFFYNKDGQQIDVHSPYAQYPYFFDSSQVLQAGMQTALSQA